MRFGYMKILVGLSAWHSAGAKSHRYSAAHASGGIRSQDSPDTDPAQALGEAAPTATKLAEPTKPTFTKPAPPTAKGVTKTTDERGKVCDPQRGNRRRAQARAEGGDSLRR